MKVYLDLIDKKDGTTRERKDISVYFERFKPSTDRELNNHFFDCWLADRTKELKKLYFSRKKGYLMIMAVDDNGMAIGYSKWRIDSLVITE